MLVSWVAAPTATGRSRSAGGSRTAAATPGSCTTARATRSPTRRAGCAARRDDPAATREALDRWLAYLRQLGIDGIAYGAVVLRRRSAGRTGFAPTRSRSSGSAPRASTRGGVRGERRAAARRRRGAARRAARAGAAQHTAPVDAEARGGRARRARARAQARLRDGRRVRPRRRRRAAPGALRRLQPRRGRARGGCRRRGRRIRVSYPAAALPVGARGCTSSASCAPRDETARRPARARSGARGAAQGLVARPRLRGRRRGEAARQGPARRPRRLRGVRPPSRRFAGGDARAPAPARRARHRRPAAAALAPFTLDDGVAIGLGNLNTPSIHQFCRIQQHPGLLDAAVKPGPVTDFVVSVGNKLWILPSGEAPVGAQRITVSDRMRFRVTELRKLFDYVLIDAPPIGSCSDALLFGQVVDGFVLIVEANLTRRENARIAKETIDSAHVKLLGVILNNRTFPIPESLYRKL